PAADAGFGGVGAGAEDGAASGSSAPTTAPISTVAPSCTAILSVPVVSAGTTLLALSVSSSNSGSPPLTTDPSGFSQRDRKPSQIDSPTPRTLIGTVAHGLLPGRHGQSPEGRKPGDTGRDFRAAARP